MVEPDPESLIDGIAGLAISVRMIRSEDLARFALMRLLEPGRLEKLRRMRPPEGEEDPERKYRYGHSHFARETLAAWDRKREEMAAAAGKAEQS